MHPMRVRTTARAALSTSPASVRSLSTGIALIERGEGIEKPFSRVTQKTYRYRPRQEAHPGSGAMVVTTREGGVRVVTLSSGDNALRESLVDELRAVLKSLESNPAVTMVILAGASDGVFSSGSAAVPASLLAGGGGGGGAGVQARAQALALLRKEYALHSLIAGYAKPIVSCMQGLAAGSGWALGAHAPYAYSSDQTAIVVDEVSSGLPPLGGSSYHLARMPGGVGLWAALTGSVLAGKDAYHLGFTNLWGTGGDLRGLLPLEAGAVSLSVPVGDVLDEDPVWNAAQDVLVEWRPEGKQEHLANLNPLGEELPGEDVDEYWNLKRWYSYWKAGDEEGAKLALSGETGVEDWGDAFDLRQGRAVWEGRGMGERREGSYRRAPPAAAAARRARMGATSAHAAAIWKGALADPKATPPPTHIQAQLEVVQACFAGMEGGAANGSGAPPVMLHTGPIHKVATQDTPAELQAQALAAKSQLITSLIAKDKALQRNWEAATLGGTPNLVAHIRETLVFLELSKGGGAVGGAAGAAPSTSTPASTTPPSTGSSTATVATSVSAGGPVGGPGGKQHLPPGLESVEAPHPLASSSPAIPPPNFLLQMVRLGVETAWPSGQLTTPAVGNIISRFLRGGATGAIPGGATGQAQVTALLKASVARVVANLHGLKDPWVLLEEGIKSGVSSPAGVGAGSGAAPVAPESPLGGEFLERDPLLEGDRQGFWVPVVETVTENGPLSPGVVYMHDEVSYGGGAAMESDLLFQEHRGQWEGSTSGLGERDVAALTPYAVDTLGPGIAFPMALAPVFNGGDPMRVAPQVARGEFLTLLYTGTRSVMPYVTTALGLAAGGEGVRGAVKERVVYTRWGKEWDEKEGKLRRSYLSEGVRRLGGEREFRETSNASAAQWRAKAHLVWPRLTQLTQYARVMVIKTMCTTSGVELTPVDIWDFCHLRLDTEGGVSFLQSQGTPRSERLLKLWKEVVAGCTPPSGSSGSGSGSASSPPRPQPHLTERQQAFLNRLAVRWAEWESVWLGEETGGQWSAAVAGSNMEVKEEGTSEDGAAASASGGGGGGAARKLLERKDKFTLGVTFDATIGGPRLTLLPTSLASSAPAAAGGAVGAPGAPKTLAEARTRIAAAVASNGGRSGGGESGGVSFWGSGGGGGGSGEGNSLSSSSSSSSSSSNSAPFDGTLRDADLDPDSLTPTPPSMISGHWDYDFVLSALSSPTGEGVVAMFGLPTTTPMLNSGRIAASVFQKEAQGRGAQVFPASVQEIKARLARIARDPSFSTPASAPASAAASSLSARRRPRTPAPELLESRSTFAAHTLTRLESLPLGNLTQTLSCISQAATLSLPQCMAMEYRAMARLLGGEGLTGAGKEGELPRWAMSPSKVSRDARKSTLAKETAWVAAHEAYLATGEGGGVVGDHFRRRYTYTPASLDDGATPSDTAEKLLDEEAEAWAKDAAAGGGGGNSSSGSSGGGSSSRKRRDEGAAPPGDGDVISAAAALVTPGDIEMQETGLRDMNEEGGMGGYGGFRGGGDGDGDENDPNASKLLKVLARRGAGRALAEASAAIEEVVRAEELRAEKRAAKEGGVGVKGQVSLEAQLSKLKGVPQWLK